MKDEQDFCPIPAERYNPAPVNLTQIGIDRWLSKLTHVITFVNVMNLGSFRPVLDAS